MSEPFNNNRCPHCKNGFGLKERLFEDEMFSIVCDMHPLTEGHILIIPKDHVSCMAALNNEQFDQYRKLYKKVKDFITSTYGLVGIFEHGITGQTVFHAHTHLLPINASTDHIILQKEKQRKISDLEEMREEFEKNGKYLFFENANEMWLVDTDLGYPRFFRDIFANLLNVKQRGNWKEAGENEKLMKEFEEDVNALKKRWKNYHKS